jgi:hypothetical protein
MDSMLDGLKVVDVAQNCEEIWIYTIGYRHHSGCLISHSLYTTPTRRRVHVLRACKEFIRYE